MYRETIKDVENFKSEEFKGLKEKDEELLYGTRNSDAVMGVQNFLNENGYTDQNDEKLTVNGRYEANTANAVIKYQKDNNLTVDGIVGDETWDSIYNKKKKKEENDSFAEGLKTKSGGWFYDRIQSIRKAQHDLGITPSGKIDEENESSAEDDFHDRVRRQWETGTIGKNTDVWNAPKVEKYPYEEGTGQEIWGRNVPKRERMPWKAIGEIEGRNIPNKPGEAWREKMPDAQAKPWQRTVPDSKGQMPWGSYVPRERNPWDINTRQGRNAYDESKTTAFFPSDYNLQNFPPYIKNALAYTDKTGETGAKVQPLAGGVRTPGINAHLNFVPDYAMKNAEKKAEAEKPYILPLSERANEASGEYLSDSAIFNGKQSDDISKGELARGGYSTDTSNKTDEYVAVGETDAENLVEKYGGVVARDYRTDNENGIFFGRKLKYILVKIGDKVKIYSDNDFRVSDDSKPYGEKIYIDEEKIILDFELDVVTKEQLTQLGWKNVDDDMVKELNAVLRKYHIVTKEDLCHFLSQVSAESECGSFLVEKYNGTPESYFSNVSGGDKYRGAGYIQLTHDYTYRDFANYVGDPDIFNKGYSYVAENYLWEAAAWFWAVYKNSFGLHQKAKEGASVEAITKIVNGDDNGLEKRKKYYNLAKSIFMGE